MSKIVLPVKSILDERDKLYKAIGDSVKIKKICSDGYGFNYGVRSDLTPECLNTHILFVKQKKIEIEESVKYILSFL